MPEKKNDNQSTGVLVTEEQISSTLAEIVQINKDSVAASAADFAEIRKISKKTEATLSEIADMQREARATAQVEWAEIRKISKKTEATLSEIADMQREARATAQVEWAEIREISKKTEVTLSEVADMQREARATAQVEWAEIREISKKTEATLSEIADMQREAKVEWAEIRELSRKNEIAIAELARFSKNLGKEVGGNADKFGSYTESLAVPSIKRILNEHFDAKYEGGFNITPGEGSPGPLEVDAWGVARNGVDAVYLVEIKSKFKPRHIRQIWRLVELFRHHMSQYHQYSVFPILAVVEVSEAHRRQIWEQGIHVIDVADGVFSLSRPPKEFQANGDHGLKVHRRALPPIRLVWDAESA